MSTQKYAIIVAGGSGQRMGSGMPKQFLELKGQPILMHTLRCFFRVADVQIILVLPQANRLLWQELVAHHHFNVPHQMVDGGATRFQSVRNGLALVPNGSLVAIHDGVRPFVSPSIIAHSFEQAERHGNAVVAVPPKDSLRRLYADGQSEMADRSQYRMVQTPQTFQSSPLKEAFKVEEQGFFTDDASVWEYAGHKVHLIEGDYRNIKITTPEDLAIGEVLLQG